jgi:Ricin-type beta-trefoil lectin domain-like
MKQTIFIMNTQSLESLVKRGTFSTFAAYAAAALMLTGSFCEARTVGIDAIGVQFNEVDQIYRFKNDHLDTSNWERGLIFPKYGHVPAQVVGKDYAFHDWRPMVEDSRTTDVISRIRASEAGDLLIAMPSAAATGNDWVRLTSGTTPDFYLDIAAGRGASFTADPTSPYWFYRRAYTSPNVWVGLPTNSISTIKSPFVFAERGELKHENPMPLMGGAVVISDKGTNPITSGVVNPNLIVMPNGDYLAMANGGERGQLFKSTDKGLTWSALPGYFDVNRQSLFQHLGSIYVIGEDQSGDGATRIYKSTDNGASFTTSVFAGLGGGDAPSHVDISGGRIWKAAPGVTGAGFFSAPVDADLMLESSWTLSDGSYAEVTLANGQKLQNGNEGTLLLTEEGKLFNVGKSNVYRPDTGWAGGITTRQPNLDNLATTTWDQDDAGPTLPYAGTKFTARYDPVSDRYWALVSGPISRGTLDLYKAPSHNGRIGDFKFVGTILDSESSSYQGFNYPFMQIDGNDIVFTLRTAWDDDRGGAPRFHDGNLFTFHRIKDFRRLNTPNRIANGGFEDGIAGWRNYSATGGERAAFAESDAKTHTGSGKFTHARDTAYQVYTYKTFPIANGKYSLRAWTRRSSGQNQCQLIAEGFGGATIKADIPAGSAYTKVKIDNIYVTNGYLKIGVWSDANAGNWLNFDDVELIRNDDFKALVGKTFQIKAKHSGKLLNVAGASLADEANVIQYRESNADNEKWTVTSAGNGYYRITARHSGKGLNIFEGSQLDNGNVQQYTYEGAANEQFQIADAGDGYYRIIARHSGRVVAVYNGGLADGDNVVQWHSENGDNEKWQFIEVP